MGLKRGLRFGNALTGWTGLVAFWLALLLAGTIGAGVLHKLGPPDGTSAGRPQPSVSQTPAPAIAIPPTIRVDEAWTGAPAAATPANNEGPHTGTASVATAPQFHTESLAIPPPLLDSPVGVPPQVATENPAARNSAAPNYKPAEEDHLTNSSTHPVDRTRVTFHYLVNSPPVDALAKRLSTQLGVQAEMRAEVTVPQSALVRYAASDDHAAARQAGKVLGEMGYSWNIEITPNRPGATSQRVIEIWLPAR